MPNAYTGAGGSQSLNIVRGSGPAADKNSGAASPDSLDAATYPTSRVLKRLLHFVGPHVFLFVVALVCTGINVIGQLITPVLIGHAIDACIGLGRVDFVVLRSLCIQLLMVVALASAAGWLAGYATNRLSYQLTFDLRQACYERFDGMPLSFLDTHSTGDLLSRVINDVDMVGEGLLQASTQLFQGVFTIVGTLVFMFSIAWPPALVVVLMTPLSMLVAWAITKGSAKSFAASQALTGQLAGHAEEVITNQRLIAAFDHQSTVRQSFATINQTLLTAGERAQFISSLSNPSTRLVNNTIYAAVAIVGCIGVITGLPVPLTAGQVQSFLSYANQYMKPFNDVSATVTQIQTAFASARRLFALMDAPQEDVPQAHTPQANSSWARSTTAPAAEKNLSLPASLQGAITFDQVCFGYDPAHPIFSDLSFHIERGQTFALVGPTGCGKTTLINLLLRFYDPTSGTIFLDNIPTTQLSRPELRRAFGMVLQDTWLFSGTVAENIAFGNPSATPEQIETAALAAHAHNFIKQLPQGYNTPIGEGGVQLSQGQCQLLCIARVMLANPAILLLDEATSSIDTRTELQVQAAFDDMMSGRTSLVVAHRLSTIKNADCILLLGNGRIVEAGTHQALLAKGGAYAKLYNSQFAPTHHTTNTKSAPPHSAATSANPTYSDPSTSPFTNSSADKNQT